MTTATPGLPADADAHSRGRRLRRHDAALVALTIAAMLPVVLAELSSDLDFRGQALVFLGVALLAGVRGALCPPTPQRPGRNRVLSRGLVFLAMSYVFCEFILFRQIPVLALGHLVMALGAAKFLELAEPRDRLVVLVIATVLLVIGAMISANIVFGLVLILYLTLGVGWLARFRLLIEQDDVDRHAWNMRNPALMRWAQVAGIQPPAAGAAPLRLVCIGYALVMLLIICILFLTVPRNVFRTQFELRVPPSLSGYTTHVSLNDLGPIIESEEPVLRLRLRLAGRPVGSEDRPVYLRGTTFGQFRAGRWFHRPRRLARSLDVERRTQPCALERWFESLDSANQLEQDVWLDGVRDGEPYLFAVYPAAAITSPDLERVEFDNSDQSLKLSQAPRGALYYRVISAHRVTPELFELMEASARAERTARETARAGRGAGPLGRRAAPPDGGESRLPPTSDISDTIHLLAARVAGADAAPLPPERHAAAAEAIEAFLRSSRFSYSRDPRGTTDPRETPTGRMPTIEEFLTVTRRGYCAHFASAMTLMCQAVGIEARLATGYRAAEFNEAGQFYRVRKKDAHAWVEVLLPGRGWTDFDPTPDAGDETRRSQRPWLATMRAWYDFVQFEWANLIVSFEAAHREELWNAITKWWRQITGRDEGGGDLRTRLRELLLGPSIFTFSQRLLYWFVALLLLLLVVLVLRAAWMALLIVHEFVPRVRRGRRSLTRHPDARYYDRLLILLARQGLNKPPELTPREFARRIAAERPDLSAVVQLTDWFYEAQYGAARFDLDRRRRISELLENLRDRGRFSVQA